MVIDKKIGRRGIGDISYQTKNIPESVSVFNLRISVCGTLHDEKTQDRYITSSQASQLHSILWIQSLGSDIWILSITNVFQSQLARMFIWSPELTEKSFEKKNIFRKNDSADARSVT